MPSRILPMEEIEHLGTKFWLPAGGHDNGVEAKQWTIIAELDRAEVSPALTQLAALNVGGYAAAKTGRASRVDVRYRLYVDAKRYNEALDALMVAMRGTANRDLGGYVPSRRLVVSDTPKRRPAVRIALRVGQYLLGTAAMAVMLAAGYEAIAHRYPPVHSRPHHQQSAPGVQQAPGPTGPSVP